MMTNVMTVLLNLIRQIASTKKINSRFKIKKIARTNYEKKSIHLYSTYEFNVRLTGKSG